MTTPADELRQASATLRKLSLAAGGDAWIADHHERGTIVHPATSTHSLFMLAADGMRAAGTPCVTRPVGDYIAAMGPNVGALLADWLDETVTEMAAAEGTEYAPSGDSTDFGSWNAALAVARAVNAATHTT